MLQLTGTKGREWGAAGMACTLHNNHQCRQANQCCCATFLHAPRQVGSYAFTTLRPQLGVLRFPDGDALTMADVPGVRCRVG